MDPFNTYFIQAAIESLPIERSFFRDRYFPTDLVRDVFGTSRVLADFRERGQKVAPFVLPRIGAIPIEREGFSVYDLEPANIAISAPLTLDHLTKRGFGEALMSGKNPADRAKTLLIEDLAELNRRVSRAEELLAVRTILENGAIMYHRTDREDIGEEIGVHFYENGDNPALFTDSTPWGTQSTYTDGNWTPGSWYQGMTMMVQDAARRGVRIEEFVVDMAVAAVLIGDGWFIEMLNNRRIDIGRVDPKLLTDDVYELGFFNFAGRDIRILVDQGVYEDPNDGPTTILPNGTVIGIAPNVGRGLYGGVTLMDPKTRQFYTVTGRRAAEAIATQRPPARETCVYARPLFVPKTKAPWIVATGVLS